NPAPFEALENVHIRKDGAPVVLETNGVPILDDTGELKGYRGVGRDVTDRKHAREALLESRNFLDEIINAVADPIFVKDRQHRWVLINHALCNFVGHSREELLGKSDYDFFPKDQADVFWDKDEVVFISGEENINEEEITNAAGEIRHIVTKKVRYADAREQQFIVGVIRDITERKIAEQSMEKSQALLMAAITQSPSGILIADAPDVRIQFANPAAFGIRGASDAPLTGIELERHSANWATFYPDGVTPYPPEKLPLSRAILEGVTSENVELVIRNATGQNRWVSTNAAPIRDKDGVIISGIVVFHDITDRKLAEEVMIQSEKMMSVGRLAAGMAHEINNPLAGIIQNTQVIRNRLTERLPQNELVAKECGTTLDAIFAYMEKRSLLRMIDFVLDSGRRAAVIVENMLGFSRKSDAYFEYCDIPALLDTAVALAATDYDLKKHYDFRHIQIVREYEESIPKVYCEANRLQQVFLNLLTNAAQAMAENDNPEKPPAIRLTAAQEGGMVRIAIEDNGPGIDEKNKMKVFEPFFTTKPVGVGTGLGLYISYFLITETHGGAMRVESTPGNGATFIITLPITRGRESLA
ncbi:MAG: PAS domain S-box protein, partial [Desulfatibacillum sp.]|nr:PAS domain S-box protein [Desulfatibacillum sp.]